MSIDEAYEFFKGSSALKTKFALLQESYVPVPKFDDNARRRGLVELHGVKAVLEEAK
jgi:hypothetical protein